MRASFRKYSRSINFLPHKGKCDIDFLFSGKKEVQMHAVRAIRVR